MTETEWLESPEPDAMLEFLQGRASDRKLRLFAVACCRRVVHLLKDDRFRHAIDVTERFADRNASADELYDALALAEMATREHPSAAGCYPRDPNPFREDLSDPLRFATSTARQAAYVAYMVDAAAGVRERAVQADLLRDLFNPFRPAAPEPGSPGWDRGAVGKIVRMIYQERRFGDLPILADAIEEAGCDDEEILGHCRQPGGHVRGCWVVDLILKKR
jgi:hypothetical protein